MEDSMIDRPNMSPYDDKTGNKRVRDGKDEPIGRLEKRPSGVIGLNDLEEYSKERDEKGEKHGVGIIDTFISNVFHKNNESDQVKNNALNDVVEDRKDDLILDGEKGGGIINTLFPNIFQNSENKNVECDQAKSDVLNAVEEKNDELNVEKLEEKKDSSSPELPKKPLDQGNNQKMKPDDYSERVFFLNNN